MEQSLEHNLTHIVMRDIIYDFRKYTGFSKKLAVKFTKEGESVLIKEKDGVMRINISSDQLYDEIEKEWLSVKDFLDNYTLEQYYREYFINFLVKSIVEFLFKDKEPIDEFDKDYQTIFYAKLMGVFPWKPKSEKGALFWESIVSLPREFEKMPHLLIPPEQTSVFSEKTFWIIDSRELKQGMPFIIHIGRDIEHSMPFCVGLCIHGEQKRFREITKRDAEKFHFRNQKEMSLFLESTGKLFLGAETVYLGQFIIKNDFLATKGNKAL